MERRDQFQDHGAEGTSIGRVPSHIKPPPSLELGISLQDVANWRALVRLHKFSMKELIAHFRTCLSNEMRAILEDVIVADFKSVGLVTTILDSV